MTISVKSMQSRLNTPWTEEECTLIFKGFLLHVGPFCIDKVNINPFTFERHGKDKQDMVKNDRVRALFDAACNTDQFKEWKEEVAILTRRNSHAVHEQLRRILGIQTS